MATKINGVPAIEHGDWSVVCFSGCRLINPWNIYHNPCRASGRVGYARWFMFSNKARCDTCNLLVPDETLGFIELCKWAEITAIGERHDEG